jgi:hypothetical protein
VQQVKESLLAASARRQAPAAVGGEGPLQVGGDSVAPCCRQAAEKPQDPLLEGCIGPGATGGQKGENGVDQDLHRSPAAD